MRPAAPSGTAMPSFVSGNNRGVGERDSGTSGAAPTDSDSWGEWRPPKWFQFQGSLGVRRTPARNRPRLCRPAVVGRYSSVGHSCGPSDCIRRGVAAESRNMSGH